jgi:hypothetical protein
VILTKIKSSLMMISWWSKHVGVILSVLMCDIWIIVLLQTSALVGPLHIVNWNARWNSENLQNLLYNLIRTDCTKNRHRDYAGYFHVKSVAEKTRRNSTETVITDENRPCEWCGCTAFNTVIFWHWLRLLWIS